MSSKKASFESRDPSQVTGKPPSVPEVSDNTPSRKASFYSKDPSDDSGLKLDTPDEDGGNISEKASFYSRDTDPGTNDVSKKNKKKYMGLERRRGNRRKAQDRRGDVRFDLTKTDRRQNEGRREDDTTPKFW